MECRCTQASLISLVWHGCFSNLEAESEASTWNGRLSHSMYVKKFVTDLEGRLRGKHWEPEGHAWRHALCGRWSPAPREAGGWRLGAHGHLYARSREPLWHVVMASSQLLKISVHTSNCPLPPSCAFPATGLEACGAAPHPKIKSDQHQLPLLL